MDNIIYAFFKEWYNIYESLYKPEEKLEVEPEKVEKDLEKMKKEEEDEIKRIENILKEKKDESIQEILNKSINLRENGEYTKSIELLEFYENKSNLQEKL